MYDAVWRSTRVVPNSARIDRVGVRLPRSSGSTCTGRPGTSTGVASPIVHVVRGSDRRRRPCRSAAARDAADARLQVVARRRGRDRNSGCRRSNRLAALVSSDVEGVARSPGAAPDLAANVSVSRAAAPGEPQVVHGSHAPGRRRPSRFATDRVVRAVVAGVVDARVAVGLRGVRVGQLSQRPDTRPDPQWPSPS